MKNLFLMTVAASATAGTVSAGGIERSTFNSALLFEDGNYMELSFGLADSDVSGFNGGFGGESGDMASTFYSLAFGYKRQLSDNLSMAIIMDEPVGANVAYPAGPYAFAESTADVESLAATGLLKYTTPDNLSFYGGIKVERLKGDVFIPFFGNYSLSTNTDVSFGYVVGAAWEKPEIAARVALTYTSAIDHTLASRESADGPVALDSSFESTVPQSLQLDFQTGVAADTLVFGSVRWVEWSEFQVLPPLFAAGSGGLPIAAYDSDYITYSLGIGRRFSEKWSGAITLTHEPASGDLMRNLGPIDGFSSISVGATYTMDNMKITGGIRYAKLGNATTTTIGSSFSGNDAVAVGLKVGYSF